MDLARFWYGKSPTDGNEKGASFIMGKFYFERHFKIYFDFVHGSLLVMSNTINVRAC